MPVFESKAPGFEDPTALPSTESEREQWQAANRAWWESQPMRYDWGDGIAIEEYSRAYYDEIDRRFFASTRPFMPWKRIPFDTLIDFDGLRDKDVLEIGVGCGSHAGLIAKHARSFTGIDLTDFAVGCTQRRLALSGISADIRRMDAEKMEFADASFDFVWSWGVIHHSADTLSILRHIKRVLRPGGKAVIMVYHRNTWNYYIVSGFFRGVLGGELFRGHSLNAILQRQTDGALARHYTEAEWQALTSGLFSVRSSRVYGMKTELIPLPRGRIKSVVERAIPDSVSRLLTNQAKMGTFLVTELERDG